MTQAPFNPHYDPFVNKTPGQNTAYPDSYWVASAGTPPKDDGAISDNISVDVAIIGGGFTGLATAMFLAQEHGIKAHVLEANQVGWGCTCRNGGQGHLTWGRLSRSQWAKRWGADMAIKMHHNTLEGFDIFKTLTTHPMMDCTPFGDGNLLISHAKSAHEKLKVESDFCNNVLGYNTKIIKRDELFEQYLHDQEAHGALIEPVGLALHPLKLAFGYMKIAQSLGAKIHSQSPVIDWQEEQTTAGKTIQVLHTPNGIVRAKSVVIATAGYTHASLHKLLAYKNMPIMANSAVTEVLSDAQVDDCGFKTHLLLTDTRKLRYYYRFLPDNRLQIGTRSAINGADAENPKHLNIVKEAIARKFPALAQTKIEYFWSGWMDISHDMIPRVVQPSPAKQIFYAQGYSGNGVSFSAYAAKNLAQLVAGKSLANDDLPIFSSPLKSHPLRPLRRFGQRLMFRYFSFLDKLP